MKNGNIKIAIIFPFLLPFLPNLVFAKKLEVDKNHSSVTFEATHMKISKVPGRFNDFSGVIDLDERDLIKSKIDFTVNVSSIDTAVPKRDEHLRSPDFFDAQKYPKAMFRSSSIKKSGNDYVLNGDMTIKNVTRPVAFNMKNLGKVADPMIKAERNLFRVSGWINRKDFGVNYGADAIVSDKIDLVINLEAIPSGNVAR